MAKQLLTKGTLSAIGVLLITGGFGVMEAGRSVEGIITIILGLICIFYREYIKKFDKGKK